MEMVPPCCLQAGASKSSEMKGSQQKPQLQELGLPHVVFTSV